MTATYETGAIVHIRCDGRRLDIPLAELDVAPGAGDAEIERALARHFEIAESRSRDAKATPAFHSRFHEAMTLLDNVSPHMDDKP